MYILTFALTILFTYIAESRFKKSDKVKGIIFSILAILLPSILAGLRSRNIGTDVAVYIEPYFNKALSYKNFLLYAKTIDSDFLFLLLVYGISKLTQNIQFLFFTIELIIMTFLYIGIYNYRKKTSMSLMMMFFLTFFYNRTFNISRQSISIIIVFFAMKYVWERNLLKYIFFIIVASGFHYSAIFMIVIYFLYNLSYMQGNNLLKGTIIICIIVIFADFQDIFMYFIKAGILPGKYMHYIEAQKGSFNFIETMYRVVNIVLISLTLKAFYKLDNNNKFLYFIMILDILIYQFGIISDYTQRISLYFGINIIYIMPQFVDTVKQEVENRNISISLLYAIQFGYWFVNYVYLKIGQTYPYEFFMLK